MERTGWSLLKIRQMIPGLTNLPGLVVQLPVESDKNTKDYKKKYFQLN